VQIYGSSFCVLNRHESMITHTSHTYMCL